MLRKTFLNWAKLASSSKNSITFKNPLLSTSPDQWTIFDDRQILVKNNKGRRSSCKQNVGWLADD